MFGRFQRYSAPSYKAELLKTLEDNAYCIKYFIEYSVEGNEYATVIEDRLTQNQTRLGRWVGHFDHEKKEIINALIHFIDPIKQAGLVFQYKINEKKFKTHWYERVDNLMKILGAMSDWDVRPFFYTQIALIEALIKSTLKKDELATAHYYSMLIENNRKLSIQLSEGIIRQYKHKFS